MLSQELDAAVQEYVESLRKVNGSVKKTRLVLIRMGYVKRKCTTSGNYLITVKSIKRGFPG